MCVCVCVDLVIKHTECMRRILFGHLWPRWLDHIFPHYLINGTVSGKQVTELKMCLDFLYNCVSNFFILRRIVINVQTFSYKAPVTCHILMKLEFLRQIFERYSDTKFNKNAPSGNRVVPCGWTDMTKLIVTFRNFASAPSKVFIYSDLPWF